MYEKVFELYFNLFYSLGLMIWFYQKRKATCLRSVCSCIITVLVETIIQIVTNKINEIDVDKIDYILRDSQALKLSEGFKWKLVTALSYGAVQ